VPLVNWLLGAVTIGAVFGFGSSEALAGAYGIAVSLLMVITTVLAALVALQWGFNPIAVLAVNGLFLVIDLIFFGANVLKLFEGGWFPLLLAVSVAFVMMTWRTGVKLVERARRRLRQPEEAFLRSLHENPPVRLPGTAAFLTAATAGMPVALVHHLKHNRVLHERLLLVSVVTLEEPRVDDADRVEVIPIGEGISRVILRSGFMETPDVKEGVKLAIAQGKLTDVNPINLTYYIGRETIVPTERPGMAHWREVLFSILHRNAERSAAYFCVPTRQVVEIGVEIEI
jgi:KUP system potassium uptake protein